MADEVTAEVVEEKLPEVMWVDRIIQWRDREGDEFVSVTHTNVDELAKHCRNTGRAYRILRVQPPTPPKKQRVEIVLTDELFLSLCAWSGDADEKTLTEAAEESPHEVESLRQLCRIIESHARIVDEEVQP